MNSQGAKYGDSRCSFHCQRKSAVAGSEIDRLGDHPYLHIDIEDTSFVPNISFGMKTIRAIAKNSKAKLDAHIMVKRPEDWIVPLSDCGIQQICVQIEAMRFPMCTMDAISKSGMEAGLAYNEN